MLYAEGASSVKFDFALAMQIDRCSLWAASRLGTVADSARVGEERIDGVCVALGHALALLRFLELNLVAVRKITKKRAKLALLRGVQARRAGTRREKERAREPRNEGENEKNNSSAAGLSLSLSLSRLSTRPTYTPGDARRDRRAQHAVLDRRAGASAARSRWSRQRDCERGARGLALALAQAPRRHRALAPPRRQEHGPLARARGARASRRRKREVVESRPIGKRGRRSRNGNKKVSRAHKTAVWSQLREER